MINSTLRPFAVSKTGKSQMLIRQSLSIHSINEAMKRGVFDPAGGNQDFGTDFQFSIFRYAIGNVPVIAAVSSWRGDECEVNSALYPTAEAEKWIGAGMGREFLGEFTSYDYLMRRPHGFRLEFPHDLPFYVSPRLRCSPIASELKPTENPLRILEWDFSAE